MTRYLVYLERADDGPCLAHVPALPGCVVRAPTRPEALQQLSDAIYGYLAWLRRHSEPAPPAGEPIEIDIAAESTGFGPFNPGDAAALLPSDLEPLTPEEEERCFRLMAYTRADLLALVHASPTGSGPSLPDDLLDWQPEPGSWSLRRLLRHVGDAEEWYVSRLVRPESLPAEWEDDQDLPLFEFLDMERRTATARLRQLTPDERSRVSYPSQWTEHPDEAWTARKALRRSLEHEREHTGQAREILAARRYHLLARLATERAWLLWYLVGLDGTLLTETPVLGDWTVKDVLAHIAAWDRWEDGAMRSLLVGDLPDLASVEDVDAYNAAAVAEWRSRSLADVLAELESTRNTWIDWLESLAEEAFFQPRFVEGGDWSFSGCLALQWGHDVEHARQIASWRQTAGHRANTGPKAVLLAALDAARRELLAAAALVPVEERSSRPVCGVWTLKDVVGHMADWERLCVDVLRRLAAGAIPHLDYDGDEAAWNRAHVDLRRDQPWDRIWMDMNATRQALLAVLAGMSQADLVRPYPSRWNPEDTAYQTVRVCIAHDREHARDLLEHLSLE
jgi:predicted RNase H-like HicB family nuclease/uncharacterized damage-inducible protein DinB